jgi:hypothetical protein
MPAEQNSGDGPSFFSMVTWQLLAVPASAKYHPLYAPLLNLLRSRVFLPM